MLVTVARLYVSEPAALINMAPAPRYMSKSAHRRADRAHIGAAIGCGAGGITGIADK